MGKVSSLNNFSGTGKEEGDGKADNYRMRRMFSFRIQKMLGDLEEKRWLWNKHAEVESSDSGWWRRMQAQQHKLIHWVPSMSQALSSNKGHSLLRISQSGWEKKIIMLIECFFYDKYHDKGSAYLILGILSTLNISIIQLKNRHRERLTQWEAGDLGGKFGHFDSRTYDLNHTSLVCL